MRKGPSATGRSPHRSSTSSQGSIRTADGIPRRSSRENGAAGDTRIQVAVRARPMNAKEIDLGCKFVWKLDDFCVEELTEDATNRTGKSHAYDHVFSPEHTNADVYEKQCKKIVQGALDGYNGTIFAYGQTSSGKTHTLMGDIEKNPGITCRAISSIFDWVARCGNAEWKIDVSYFEIYNENITDLLNPHQGKNLKITEDKTCGPVVRDATEVSVHQLKDCLDIIRVGEKSRHYAATDMNDYSSRSHTLFLARIESKLGDESQSEETQEIMATIAESFHGAEKEVYADKASLYLVDKKEQELYVQSGNIALRIPMSTGIAGAAATTGKTINITDAYSDPRFNSSVDKKTGYLTKSILAAPVFDNAGQVVGVVQFINKKLPGSDCFDAGDERVVESLAKLLGPLIATAQSNAGMTVTSRLNIVDLAGSERMKKSGSVGAVLKEGANINTSLMTLGQVISLLSEGTKQHIPFRNSKLTQLLSTSLGGNANTSIIAAFSPASRNRSETLSTLQFASRAKKIVNHARQNMRRDQTDLVIAYELEIAKLKAELKGAMNNGSKGQDGAVLCSESTLDRVDVDASESFTSSFRDLESATMEAETYVNAFREQGSPMLRLRALFAVMEGGSRSGEFVVVATNMSDEGDRSNRGHASQDREVISVDNFYARLAWLRRCRADAPESDQQSVWDQVSTDDSDLWSAAAAGSGRSGTRYFSQSAPLPMYDLVKTPAMDASNGTHGVAVANVDRAPTGFQADAFQGKLSAPQAPAISCPDGVDHVAAPSASDFYGDRAAEQVRPASSSRRADDSPVVIARMSSSPELDRSPNQADAYLPRRLLSSVHERRMVSSPVRRTPSAPAIGLTPIGSEMGELAYSKLASMLATRSDVQQSEIARLQALLADAKCTSDKLRKKLFEANVTNISRPPPIVQTVQTVRMDSASLPASGVPTVQTVRMDSASVPTPTVATARAAPLSPSRRSPSPSRLAASPTCTRITIHPPRAVSPNSRPQAVSPKASVRHLKGGPHVPPLTLVPPPVVIPTPQEDRLSLNKDAGPLMSPVAPGTTSPLLLFSPTLPGTTVPGGHVSGYRVGSPRRTGPPTSLVYLQDDLTIR